MSINSTGSAMLSSLIVGVISQAKPGEKKPKQPVPDKAPDETPVKNQLIFKWSPDSAVCSINNVGVKNILINNGLGSGKDCEYFLQGMTWKMVAAAVAGSIAGKDIDESKADTLSHLLTASNRCDKPVEVLKELNMPFGQAVISTLLFKFRYSQYYSYEQFVKSAKAGIKWGSFPADLPVKISGEFRKAVGEPAKPAAAPERTKAATHETRKRELKIEQKPVDTQKQEPATEGCAPGQVINPMTGECVDVEK